ncbi:hypothetical protein ACFQ6Q_00610 [Streptomyces sp. NPDC056437]|uniref:hypothetical protein n=1 Tax=Streptomyces sp. NPDC056437 TaxID=3345816 RepID=UPI0036B2DB2B
MTIIQVPAPKGYTGATLHLELDPTEHERRQACRLSGITNPGLLDTLMALPQGHLVPYAALTKRQKYDVHRAPRGVLHYADSMVTRLAVRPGRVHLATVRSPTCSRTALGNASKFAPFCARAVICRIPPVRPETVAEFSFWGVGILIEHANGELETVIEPEPHVVKRHTPAAWQFVEQAYAAYLTHTAPDRTSA